MRYEKRERERKEKEKEKGRKEGTRYERKIPLISSHDCFLNNSGYVVKNYE